VGRGIPEMWQCNDCGACWSESKAKKCLHCLSNNIFIYWKPGMIIKPKRIQLRIKRFKLRSK
jgi:hypothetical protein